MMFGDDDMAADEEQRALRCPRCGSDKISVKIRGTTGLCRACGSSFKIVRPK